MPPCSSRVWQAQRHLSQSLAHAAPSTRSFGHEAGGERAEPHSAIYTEMAGGMPLTAPCFSWAYFLRTAWRLLFGAFL